MVAVVVDVLSWADARREAGRIAGAADHIEHHSGYLRMAQEMGLEGRGSQYHQDVDDVAAELNYIQARIDAIRALVDKEKTQHGW